MKIQSKAPLFAHNQKTYSLKDCRNQAGFSREENQIIRARCADSLSFCQQSEADQKIFANEIILAVCGITGCNAPSSKMYLSVVINLIVDLIADDYPLLNIEEVLLAFKLNSTSKLSTDGSCIPFTMSNFNTTFVAQVLNKYKSARNIIDGKIKNELD